MADGDVRDELLALQEELLQAQLRAVRRLRGHGEEAGKAQAGKSRSKIGVALDILKDADKPLHVSELISRAATERGVVLDRESLVSALVKKVNAGTGLVRTAPNTFAWSAKD